MIKTKNWPNIENLIKISEKVIGIRSEENFITQNVRAHFEQKQYFGENVSITNGHICFS